MSDLIERQAAIDGINNLMEIHFDRRVVLKKARNVVEQLPSAQPIIHCGTCKWVQCNMRPDGYLPKGVEEFECRHWCGPCDPDDFCSHAERRTDGVDS